MAEVGGVVRAHGKKTSTCFTFGLGVEVLSLYRYRNRIADWAAPPLVVRNSL